MEAIPPGAQSLGRASVPEVLLEAPKTFFTSPHVRVSCLKLTHAFRNLRVVSDPLYLRIYGMEKVRSFIIVLTTLLVGSSASPHPFAEL